LLPELREGTDNLPSLRSLREVSRVFAAILKGRRKVDFWEIILSQYRQDSTKKKNLQKGDALFLR